MHSAPCSDAVIDGLEGLSAAAEGVAGDVTAVAHEVGVLERHILEDRVVPPVGAGRGHHERQGPLHGLSQKNETGSKKLVNFHTLYG